MTLMGKEQELRLDQHAIEEARAASRMALMSGQATSASVADVAVHAYLAARDEQAEVVEPEGWFIWSEMHGYQQVAAEHNGEPDLTPLYASPSGVTEAMVEAAARMLCQMDGYNPDRLEPGDVPRVDGRCTNGDPGHFHWRDWDVRARAALTAALGVRDEGMGEGWIEWSGGECPVDPDAMVSIRCAGPGAGAPFDFQQGLPIKASNCNWNYPVGDSFRIIAYRLPTPPIQGDAK